MESTWSTLKTLYRLYSDEAWIPLYYPLSYFANVVRAEFDHNHLESSHETGQHLTLPRDFDRNAVLISVLCLLPVLILLLPTTRDKSTQKWYHADNECYIKHGSKDPTPDSWLTTDSQTGLTEAEVTERRQRYGWNKTYTGIKWPAVMRGFVLRPTNVALEAAALLALLRHDWRDLLAVSGILAWLTRGTVHAVRAHHDLALSLIGSMDVRVECVRDGATVQIQPEDLVVGDIIHIEEGDTLPAECRISSKSEDFSVDQSSITGDAKAVHKYEGDMCYATTTVSHGKAVLLVQGIGYDTFIGRTLTMLEVTQDRHKPLLWHLQEYKTLLRKLSIGIACLILTLTFVSTIFTGRTDLHLLLTLTIIGAPVSLNTIIAFYRSLGALHLSSLSALVVSDTNVEALSGIDIILVDKTGTLTKNELLALKPQLLAGSVEELLLTAYLSLPPDQSSYDPIDAAFARATEDYPHAQRQAKQYRCLEYLPFDPETRLIQSTVRSPGGEEMVCVRGAPRAVLDLCTADHPDDTEIVEKYKQICMELAAEGHRSLSVARKIADQKWELLGVVPLRHPLRDDSAAMIKLAASMGVSVRMMTGDATSIAVKTAEALGMDVKPCDLGKLLGDTMLSEADDHSQIEAASVYSELFPEHKSQLVRILQEKGHVVAITGDSVNDAPSLRRANCGIAVEGSTETAQSAADIVMQAGGLGPIIKAIQTSLQVFHLVHSYLVYRVVITMHLVFVIVLDSWTASEPLDTTLLIVALRLGDLLSCWSDHNLWKMPFPRSPVRWSTRQIWFKAVPMSIILTMGTWLVMMNFPKDVEQTKSPPRLLSLFLGSGHAPSTRNQALLLNLVLMDHWLIPLTQVHGRVWRYSAASSGMIATMFIGIAATLLGLTGRTGLGNGLSLLLAGQVWLVSFGSLMVVVALLCVSSNYDLMEVEVP